MIAEDIEIDFSGSEGRERDGNVHIPTSTIPTVAGVPIPVGNLHVEAGRAQNVAS